MIQQLIFSALVIVLSLFYSEHNPEVLKNVHLQQNEPALKLFNVFKIQLDAYKMIEDKKNKQNELLLKMIYNPYKNELWKGYLGDEKSFLKWTYKQAFPKFKNLDQRLENFQSYNFDSLFRETSINFEELTGLKPAGNWYILFGPGWNL